MLHFSLWICSFWQSNNVTRRTVYKIKLYADRSVTCPNSWELSWGKILLTVDNSISMGSQPLLPMSPQEKRVVPWLMVCAWNCGKKAERLHCQYNTIIALHNVLVGFAHTQYTVYTGTEILVSTSNAVRTRT